MKSPLKDGLNFKCLGVVSGLIPKKSIVSSFLFYSGAIELKLASSGRFVVGHTNRPFVYEFWYYAVNDAPHLALRSKYYFENLLGDDPLWSVNKMFTSLQESWFRKKDPNVRVVYFFLLNRCSENGLISSGKLDRKHFNPVSLSHMKNFTPENFFIKFDPEDNFLDTLQEKDGSEYLLFPVGECSHNLFEHGKNKGFETTMVHHEGLSEMLKQRDKKWVVLYKNHKRVFDLYKGYHIIMVDQYGRKTNRKDKCEDIVIANF
jgi:hypothetical protein